MISTIHESLPALPELIPPNDLDAEGVVLAHAMILGTYPFSTLRPEHFYSDANGHIFRAVKSLEDDGKPVDVVAVSRILREDREEGSCDDRLKAVGGVAYLARLVETSPAATAAHAAAHAAAIIEMWKRRCLSQALQEANVRLRLGQLDSAGCWAWFSQRAKEIANAL
jgi:replicative DNA helicase